MQVKVRKVLMLEFGLVPETNPAARQPARSSAFQRHGSCQLPIMGHGRLAATRLLC